MKDSYHQSFRVSYDYPVLFTRDLFAVENRALAGVLGGQVSRAAFFIDTGLCSHWPDLIEQIERWCARNSDAVDLVAPVQPVPGGERIKNNLKIVDRVGRLVAKRGLCRQSYVIVVGGGAVLDAVGFATATVHRGLRQVRVPTTVISQADSGVGVKNGLNRFGVKNFYGAFAPPAAVLNDTQFLRTLSNRDWISGVAEAFKVAIIKDVDFLEYLVNQAHQVKARDPDVMDRIVRRCATLHLDHIRTGGDPFETGSARPLDFGHWAAHRLEAMTDYSLRHGEAVAIGIALDLWAAVRLDLLEPDAWDPVCSAMERCGLTLWHDALQARNPDGALALLEGVKQFHEHLGGRLALTMPRGLGAKVEIDHLPEELVEEAIHALENRRSATRSQTQSASRFA